jgi:hypothetical protein
MVGKQPSKTGKRTKPHKINYRALFFVNINLFAKNVLSKSVVLKLNIG